MDSRDYNVIFTSSNPLTSAAARVFLHTLISARKLKRVNVFACSPEPSATPELVAALKKFGYRVETSHGTDEIDIRFADNGQPIKLKTNQLFRQDYTNRKQGGNHFVSRLQYV